MREAVISFPLLGLTLDPPYCVQLGGFCVYYYGIIIAVGFLLAIWYVSRVCSRFDETMDDMYGYIIWGTLAGVVCARLYYCLTYTDALGAHTYLQDPASILRIRDGGLAIYGGVIGAVAALLIRARVKKQSVWPALDLTSFGFLIGQLIGRWGNFFNREAYGYETDVFCRMGLTLNGETVYVHPTFLYESLWNLLGFVLLHLHAKKRRRWQGQYFLLYLLWYGVGRAAIEGLRSDSLWLVPGVVRISQLLAAVSALAALALYLVNVKRVAAGKKPVLGTPLPEDAPEEESEAPAPAETNNDEQAPVPAPDGAEASDGTNNDEKTHTPAPDGAEASDEANNETL